MLFGVTHTNYHNGAFEGSYALIFRVSVDQTTHEPINDLQIKRIDFDNNLRTKFVSIRSTMEVEETSGMYWIHAIATRGIGQGVSLYVKMTTDDAA